MRPARNANPFPTGKRKNEARANGRFRCELLHSTLGDVLDLSSTGMRIRGKGRQRLKPGDVITMALTTLDEQFGIKGEVIWVKKAGFFRYEVGVKFVDLSPETVQRLTAAALVSAQARTM